MRDDTRFAVLVFGLVTAVLVGVLCCKPSDVPAVEKPACVILRALAQDGTVDEVCAYADELAPLVPTIVASREGVAPEEPKTTIALAIRKPPKPTPRRHCVSWQAVDGGTAHGSGPEGSARPGDGGGGRLDAGGASLDSGHP